MPYYDIIGFTCALYIYFIIIYDIYLINIIYTSYHYDLYSIGAGRKRTTLSPSAPSFEVFLAGRPGLREGLLVRFDRWMLMDRYGLDIFLDVS